MPRNAIDRPKKIPADSADLSQAGPVGTPLQARQPQHSLHQTLAHFDFKCLVQRINGSGPCPLSAHRRDGLHPVLHGLMPEKLRQESGDTRRILRFVRFFRIFDFVLDTPPKAKANGICLLLSAYQYLRVVLICRNAMSPSLAAITVNVSLWAIKKTTTLRRPAAFTAI